MSARDSSSSASPLGHGGLPDGRSGGIADQTIGRFLANVGCKSPAPGGGAVASVTGALAAALARMVVSYSIGKKALAEHEGKLRRADETLTRAGEMFLQLGDEDAAAYGLVNELSRLPETDERRVREYAGAVEASIQAPLAVLALSGDLMRLIESLVGASNRHLRSDLAIAAILCEACGESAWWNVRVNLSALGGVPGEPGRARELREQCAAILERSRAARGRVEEWCQSDAG